MYHKLNARLRGVVGRDVGCRNHGNLRDEGRSGEECLGGRVDEGHLPCGAMDGRNHHGDNHDPRQIPFFRFPYILMETFWSLEFRKST